MSIPNYDKVTRPLLDYLMKANKAVDLATIRAEVARMFDVTEEEQQERLNNGERRFANYVRWIAHDMRAAGLLWSPQRGCFEVTQEGRAEFQKGTDLSRKYLKQQHQYLKQQRQGIFPSAERDASVKSQQVEATDDLESSGERNDLSPDEEIQNALEHIDADLENQILERLRHPKFGEDEFERLTIKLLLAMGYGKSGKKTKRSRDGGIDGIVNEDKLGLSKIGIQAKRNAKDNNVGVNDIKNFFASIHGKLQKGCFVTTASFTNDARTEAKEKGIRLIDGTELAKLMREHNVGCKVKESYTLKEIDESFPWID